MLVSQRLQISSSGAACFPCFAIFHFKTSRGDMIVSGTTSVYSARNDAQIESSLVGVGDGAPEIVGGERRFDSFYVTIS